MNSNAPYHAFSAGSTAQIVDTAPQGFVAWCLARLQRSVCALHGHDAILQYERTRIYLRCTSCGYETPGWEVANNATLHHHVPDTRGALAAPPDLAVARKIA